MRSLAAGGAALCLVLVLPLGAGAHPFSRWSGTSGPYSWEAKRLSCGAVGGERSRVRAHTRWRTSPANGYQRVKFQRQIRDGKSGTWTTVQRQRSSLKDSRLEGTPNVVHWWQWFGPLAGEAGKTSRYRIVFAWLRDRPGPDRLVFRRLRTLRPCVVGG